MYRLHAFIVSPIATQIFKKRIKRLHQKKDIIYNNLFGALKTRNFTYI